MAETIAQYRMARKRFNFDDTFVTRDIVASWAQGIY